MDAAAPRLETIYASDTITAIWREGVSASVLVCFAGAGIKRAPEEEANRGFVEKAQISAVFITPRLRTWYPRAHTEPCIRAVRTFLGSREVSTTGGSMGGYAAIKYARGLEARHVVAFAPQFSIDPSVIRNRSDIYTANFDPVLNSGMEIRPEDGCCPVDIVFDPTDENDREHFELIRRRIRCRAVAVPNAGHGVETLFSGGADLPGLVANLRSDRLPDVLAMVRGSKRKSVWFHLAIFRKAIDKKPKTALWALERASEIRPAGAPDRLSRVEALLLLGHARQAEQEMLEAYEGTARLSFKCGLALKLADIYEALEMSAESLDWLRVAESHNSDDSVLRLRLALAQARQGDYGAAEPTLRDLIDELDMPDAWFGLSLVHAQRGDLEAAIGCVLRAYAAKPNNTPWRGRLIEFLTRVGRQAEAEGFGAGAVRSVGDAGAWSDWSRFLRQRGRLSEALVAARRAVDLKPSEGALRAQLARMLRESGRLQEALEFCRSSTERWPWQATAFTQLALSEEALGDIDAAVAAARRAAGAEPDATAHRVLLADILTRNGRIAEALQALTEGEAELRSPGPELLAAAARAKAHAGDLAGAVASVSAAISRAPQTQIHHGQLAGYLLRQKRFAEAIEPARRAEALGPSPLWIRRILIGALEGVGDRAAAIEACRAAIAAHPEAEDLHARLVQLLVAAGRPAEASEAAARAVAAGIANAHLHGEHAKALGELGRLDDAIASARLATELAPDRPGLWGALAQVLLKARQFAESEAAAKRGLALAPDAGWIATLARRAAAGG